MISLSQTTKTKQKVFGFYLFINIFYIFVFYFKAFYFDESTNFAAFG